MENGRVIIRKRGADRIRRGHLWVYRSDVIDSSGAAPGDIVAVHEEHGTVIGKAFYSSKSQIALRFLTRGDFPIDETLFLKRFSDADRLRELLGIDPHLSRRVFSEGDIIPGLIIDRYADRLVMQCLTQGTDRLQSLFIKMLDRYSAKSIFIRNDNRVRELEGLDLRTENIGDPIPDPLLVQEGNRRFYLSITSGQKTGAFLDQRWNHLAARNYARGRCLDAFSYTGGFAIHLADLCESVEAVDISETAIAQGRQNAVLNEIQNIDFIQANAFDFLRQKYKDGARYDIIILDPPAFARSRESLEGALRGYKEINYRAMRLLQPGGILISCSCSHHVSEGVFAEMLAEASRDAGCWLRVLERRTQAPDHPILLTVPETFYLKCFIAEILY